MRKIFTFAVALSLMTSLYAQTAGKIGVTDPEFIEPLKAEDITIQGVNSDGTILYGQDMSANTCFYNFNNASDPMSSVIASDNEYFGVTVGGMTTDNLAIISHYMRSYVYDVTNGNVIAELESPNPSCTVDAWGISADGSVIGCNLATEMFEVIPMVAIRQADGTYSMEYLEYDKMDATGCLAQYTQVRFVSEDGNYLIGIQPDNRGMGGRLVVWERQADGTYKFTTPLDPMLYDLSYEKPGEAPEFDDYVTADLETEEELFYEQMAEYDKAFEEYENNYKNFTRNGSSLEIYLMHKSVKSNVICVGFYDKNNYNVDDMKEDPDYMIPLFYDYATGETKIFENFAKSFAFEKLPTGEYVVAKENSGLYQVSVVDKNNEVKPICEWLNDMTGKDFSQQYTYSFYDYMADEQVEDVFTGLPHFSADGKSLVFAGYNPEEGLHLTSILRFDNSIFGEDTPTGIKTNIVNEVTFEGGIISLGNDKQGTADVYALNGASCGSYDINGSLNLNGILSAGAYIVKVNVEGQQPVSMKLVIK